MSSEYSSLSPCAIIPVFNHHHKIEQVLLQLHALGLPCILIDDGSAAQCAAVLNSLSTQYEWIHLLRLPRNAGKGVAVCEGLRLAFAQGYSHALQVDADGQHDLRDAPQFLQLAQTHPLAVISGFRAYDAMPRARRSGRKLTDFWVRINTLSSHLKDSMCGYRLYPLAATVALLQRRSMGRRMDFDTDILVQLYWSGLAVKNIETHVIYHDDVPSHFAIWSDNLRISWMHTRLFFGMLVRIPYLLSRR